MAEAREVIRRGLARIGGTRREDLDHLRYAIGEQSAMLARLGQPPTTLADAEFKVFSQWGEDGIIQYLVRQLPAIPRTFVEIGVQDYRESNTRFLLMHDNWRGTAVDGGTSHVEFIRGGETGWRWAIDPVSSFVTAESVNALVARSGQGGLGLLSIDVDGVDYWLWEAVSDVQPWIVVIEYNAFFGAELPLSVPYRPDFAADLAHSSWLYQGASLAALAHLASERGYQLVGVNSAGINAFFVRRDIAGELWSLTPGEAYRPTHVRTQRGPAGELTYQGDPEAILRAMRTMPLVDVRDGSERTISEWFDV